MSVLESSMMREATSNATTTMAGSSGDVDKVNAQRDRKAFCNAMRSFDEQVHLHRCETQFLL